MNRSSSEIGDAFIFRTCSECCCILDTRICCFGYFSASSHDFSIPGPTRPTHHFHLLSTCSLYIFLYERSLQLACMYNHFPQCEWPSMHEPFRMSWHSIERSGLICNRILCQNPSYACSIMSVEGFQLAHQDFNDDGGKGQRTWACIDEHIR